MHDIWRSDGIHRNQIVAKVGEGAQYITSKAWPRRAREKIPNCLSANPMLC